MSDKKQPKAKKEAKPKRTKIEPTEANLKVVRSVGVMEYSLPAIKKALNCTWHEAVALRHAALKADKGGK